MTDLARSQLAQRLGAATSMLTDQASPVVVVDLDAFDANAADLLRRANGTPIRVASKSLRIPALLERALALPGFAGVLGYALREALWLVEQQVSTDIVVAYPTTDAGGIRKLLADDVSARAITLMIDSTTHLDLLDSYRDGSSVPIRIALDVDAGFRLGRSHIGPKRSPLQDLDQVLTVAKQVIARPGFDLVGVMTYEGQVAGVQDSIPGQRLKSAVVRRMKIASMAQLAERRGRIATGLAEIVELEFWNGGGSGSLEATSTDAAVTELAAGSGLLVPTLFDHYRSFEPRPAAFYGLPVVRRPNAEVVTVAGGGFLASGPAGVDRAPTPWAPPGLQLTSLEGAGEVQTPLTGPGTTALKIGDLVWFRHAKSGELAEHTNLVHLVSSEGGAESPGGPGLSVETVRSYRGFGCSW